MKESGLARCFNPLDRGNLYQIPALLMDTHFAVTSGFNPLDRGNLYQMYRRSRRYSSRCRYLGFNPLDRGNLYQIGITDNVIRGKVEDCFNPLDRGNLYQI